MLQLEQELNALGIGTDTLRVVIDTYTRKDGSEYYWKTDEEGDEYEYLIVRIPRSEYDAIENKHDYVKQRILEELERLAVAA